MPKRPREKKPYIQPPRAKYVICPGCGQEQEKRDVRVYKCPKCQSVFEEADDDGNYFNDPTARLRSKERWRERNNERL